MKTRATPRARIGLGSSAADNTPRSELGILIRGGTVVTMDDAGTVVEGDVLVRGGRIESVTGRNRSGSGRVMAGPYRVLDASGCAVIPGFVQAHVHLCQVLFRGMADDLPLLSWLKERIWPLEAAHDEESLTASAELGIAELLLGGTTAILDMGTVHHQDAVFAAMEGGLIRGVSGKAMMDAGQGVPRGLKESTKSSLAESVRLLERWHGAANGRLRYGFAPRFILSCTDRLLREVARLAEAHGALVHTHASEHRDERRAVIALRGKSDVMCLAELGVRGPRTVLAHCVQVDRTEIRMLARDGTGVTHCPSANLKLASGIAPLKTLLRAGVRVGLGGDGAPCNNRLDAFTEMRSAALLAKAREVDAQAVTAYEVLHLATRGGARVLGLEAEIGSIEPGKRADIAVVRLDGAHAEPGGDAVSRLVYACTPSDVEHVIVDGQIAVQSGNLRALRLEAVRDEARRQAAKLLARAKLTKS